MRASTPAVSNNPSESLLPPPGGRVTVAAAPRADGVRPVICSLATGTHRALLAQSAPTLAAYGERHGWDVVISSENLEPSRPASWLKVRLVQELLADHDFVFWVDADAMVVDLARDLLSEIDDDADIWFARHPQEHVAARTVPNAGVFLARASPFTTALLDAMWGAEQFIEHNWWENAALLDLLGYLPDSPYTKVRESEWDARIGVLDLAWNSVPGYCESPRPAVNHHARADHENFERRREAMIADRLSLLPSSFAATAAPRPVAPQRRTHEFTGVPLGAEPTKEEMLALIDRLDELNEVQRLKIIELLDLLEAAVTDGVAFERRATNEERRAVNAEMTAGALREQVDRVTAELDALRRTKLFRAAAPLRALYKRLRRRS